MSTRNISWRG